MLHRIRTLTIIVVAAVATAGIAVAALGGTPSRHFYPDLPGTRSLSVTGHVTGYRFADRGTLVASVQTSRCAGVARWNYAATVSATASISCGASSSGGSGAAAQHLVSAQGNRLVRVVLAPDGVDRPDRLDVFARRTGHRIASWPLFDRPDRVVLFRGTAILSALNRHALYALRISDGRIAVLGIAHAGDRPIIGRDGVVYQDSMYLEENRIAPSRVTLKLVPLAAVERQLSLAGQRIRTPWKITAMGMDGSRVVFAIHDPTGQCDEVKLWSPSWPNPNVVARVTHPTGPTCRPGHEPGGVTNVAMAGQRLAWTTRYGTTTRVLAESDGPCREWVVTRPGPGVPVAALAGDGGVLAYALRRGAVGVVSVEGDDWYGEVVSRSRAEVRAISVDSDRIATLYTDGTVTVTAVEDEDGELVNSFDAGRARAVALGGDTVAVLHSGRLDAYSAETGLQTGSWPVPANARSVDLQYGIAVIAAGGNVLAVNVHTGRTARLLHVQGRAAAQVDTPGALVQFNVGGYGYLRFVPMSRLEALTR